MKRTSANSDRNQFRCNVLIATRSRLCNERPVSVKNTCTAVVSSGRSSTRPSIPQWNSCGSTASYYRWQADSHWWQTGYPKFSKKTLAMYQLRTMIKPGYTSVDEWWWCMLPLVWSEGCDGSNLFLWGSVQWNINVTLLPWFTSAQWRIQSQHRR